MSKKKGDAGFVPTYERDQLAQKLLLTERGGQWLANFAAEDRPHARELVSLLTLVSLTEFERRLTERICELAEQFEGPIALFTIRELPPNSVVFDQHGKAVPPVPGNRDIGSEGRISSMIRNLARQAKFLNNPDIKTMREARCRAVLFVDDILGSGHRVTKFLAAFYQHPTIRSWFSYKQFNAVVVAYASTGGAEHLVRRATMAPRVEFVRSCPTLGSLVQYPDERNVLRSFCQKYADKYDLRLPLGYGGAFALLVFEHGCPNNCPSILWREARYGGWTPLFPGRSVAVEEGSHFPPEIVRNEPMHMLVAAGAARVAQSSGLLINRPLPASWIAVLALFARGARRVDAVEAATRMSYVECARIIEDCVGAGFLTQRWRLTDSGRAELKGICNAKQSAKALPNISDGYYYPTSLRDHSTC